MSIAGKVLQHLLAEETTIEMSVDFGSADAFVSKHHLNGTERSTPFEEVCGKGVAEGVGRNDLVDVGRLDILLDVVKHRDTRKVTSATGRDKYEIFVLRFDGYVGARIKPVVEFVNSSWRNGDNALFVALACDTNEPFIEEEIGEFEVAHFAHTESAAIQHFYECVVTLAFGL